MPLVARNNLLYHTRQRAAPARATKSPLVCQYHRGSEIAATATRRTIPARYCSHERHSAPPVHGLSMVAILCFVATLRHITALAGSCCYCPLIVVMYFVAVAAGCVETGTISSARSPVVEIHVDTTPEFIPPFIYRKMSRLQLWWTGASPPRSPQTPASWSSFSSGTLVCRCLVWSLDDTGMLQTTTALAKLSPQPNGERTRGRVDDASAGMYHQGVTVE
jgi:hypothetical protein